MKKILSLTICIIYILAVKIPAFCEYDFSDEAQEEFNRTYGQQIIISPYQDYSKKRKKTDTKNNNERKNYTPDVTLSDEIKNINPELNNNNKIIKLQQYPSDEMLYGSVVQIPSGTSFEVAFDSGISSGSLETNDRLTVRLVEDLAYNGQVVAPAGSLVYGSTQEAKNAGYAYGAGSLALNFNQILTPDGNMLQISTGTIIVKAKSERAAKMSRDVLVGALGSMLVGAAFTALSGSNNWGRNMAIYGGIGALGGGIHGAMQRGDDVQIPDGTILKVTLTDNLRAAPYFKVNNRISR